MFRQMDYNFMNTKVKHSYAERGAKTYIVSVIKPYRHSFKISCYDYEDINIKIIQYLNAHKPRRCMQIAAVEYNFSEVQVLDLEGKPSFLYTGVHETMKELPRIGKNKYKVYITCDGERDTITIDVYADSKVSAIDIVKNRIRTQNNFIAVKHGKCRPTGRVEML